MRFDATRLTQLGRVSAIALSPDGSWLAVQVARLDRDEKKYVSDLWRVPTAPGGGAPVQLTRGEHSDTCPRFRRDGSLGFLTDRPQGASEKDAKRQVWLLPAAGGEPRPLTDEPLGVHDFAFARAGDRLVVIADVLPGVAHEEQRARDKELSERGPSGLHFTAPPVRFWDHWLGRAAPHAIAYDEAGGGRRDLTPLADREYRLSELGFQWDLSDDGQRIALTTRRTGADRAPEVALHVIDTASGERLELGAEMGATYTAPRFSPTGARLAAARWLREPGRCGRITIQLFELGGGGSRRTLAEDWDLWPTIHGWTADGRALLCTADLRGDSPVFSVERQRGEVTRITGSRLGHRRWSPPRRPRRLRRQQHPPPPPGAVPGPPRAGRRAASARQPVGFSPTTSPRRHRRVVRHPGRRRRAGAVLPGPPARRRPPAHPALDPRRPGQPERRRLALAVEPARHGGGRLRGPLAQPARLDRTRPGVHRGGVEQPVGRRLLPRSDGGGGRRPARRDLDGDRIAAMGGSFGGYMTNWIGGQTDRFRCLITPREHLHFSSFHGTTDEPAFFALELGGSPYGDLARRSSATRPTST